jgi:hypothetical protein
MKVKYETNFVQISYDEENFAVIAAWKRPTTTEAYKDAFRKILEIFRSNKAAFFISDIYHQGVVGTDNRRWMMETILPEAVKFGLKKVATIAPDDIFKRFYVETVRDSSKQRNEAVEFQFFPDLISAQAWVLNKEILV